ncbi:hypothetical protein CDCA_CDCA17G4303 [Cyanidium caldarium]|uniref:Small multi-drug export protein n=1 Tax=Cyanidium caldarium TaxID=2771 RepID=A0AAV9J2K5_CYACA|nr:hypothetical protein CDCA_CDCA17G4303 [Cyanidium caldarium]
MAASRRRVMGLVGTLTPIVVHEQVVRVMHHPWRRSLVSTPHLPSRAVVAAKNPAPTTSSSTATIPQHLGHHIAASLQRATQWPAWLVLMAVSALPVVELRGGVPVGMWLGLSPWQTLVLAVVGNMVPIPLILAALQSSRVQRWSRPLLDSVARRIPPGMGGGVGNDGNSSSASTSVKRQALALALFVGVPLPGTGAWSGAIAAYLLRMPFGTAMLAITAGVWIAGGIMLALVLLGRIGGLIVAAALLGAAASALWRSFRAAA